MLKIRQQIVKSLEYSTSLVYNDPILARGNQIFNISGLFATYSARIHSMHEQWRPRRRDNSYSESNYHTFYTNAFAARKSEHVQLHVIYLVSIW